MKALRRLLGLAEQRLALGGFGGTQEATTTVIGEGMTVKGELHGAGPIVVLGRFEGDIVVNGTLTVGEGGYVDANISASTIVIDGVVRGNLSADTKVDIGPTGALTGSVKSEIWVERTAKPETTS